MITFLLAMLGLIAVGLGVRGDTWDNKKAGIKRITRVGWAALVTGLVAAILTCTNDYLSGKATARRHEESLSSITDAHAKTVASLNTNLDGTRTKLEQLQAQRDEEDDFRWLQEVFAKPARELNDALLEKAFGLAKEKNFRPVDLMWDNDSSTGLNVEEAPVRDWAITGSTIKELNLRKIRCEWLRIDKSDVGDLRFLDVQIGPRLFYVTDSNVQFWPKFSSFRLRVDAGAKVLIWLSSSNSADLFIDGGNIDGSRISGEAVRGEAIFSGVDLSKVMFVDVNDDTIDKFSFSGCWSSVKPEDEKGLPPAIAEKLYDAWQQRQRQTPDENND